MAVIVGTVLAYQFYFQIFMKNIFKIFSLEKKTYALGNFVFHGVLTGRCTVEHFVDHLLPQLCLSQVLRFPYAFDSYLQYVRLCRNKITSHSNLSNHLLTHVYFVQSINGRFIF